MATRRALPVALALTGALLGCGGDVGGRAVTSSDTPSPSPPSEASPVPRDDADLSPALADQVDQAVADLGGQLGVATEEIEVVSAEEVTWGDTSLGCPQPGMRYAQVVTEGVRIVLAHEGIAYSFHAGTDRPDPFLCEDPQEPVG